MVVKCLKVFFRVNALIMWVYCDVFKSIPLSISDKIVNGNMNLTYI